VKSSVTRTSAISFNYEMDMMDSPIAFDEGLEKFLVAFLERAMKDYLHLDPTSHNKSSEFSDGCTEFQEWKTAADFIFRKAKVMDPWAVTFDEICDVLNIDPDFMRERIQKEAPDKET